MATLEEEVAGLTASTTSLLSAVNVSKATLDTKTAEASTSASNAATSLTNTTAQAVIATTKATEAAASAALATEITGYDTIEDALIPKLNALAPYNGVIGTDTKQQQENLVFNTTVGNEYKLADTTRFRKVDGKVFDTYGPELVTNGDFSDGTTGWSLGSGWSIADGKATQNSASSNLQQSGILEINKTYIIEFTLDITAGVIYVFAGTKYSDSISTNGRHSLLITSEGNTNFFIQSNSIAKCSVDNISLKEVQTLDFSRNGNHPFEVYPTTSLTAPNEVLEGDYVVVENPELVTNGTFDTDTDWTKGTGWTISGGVASCDGTNSDIYQSSVIGSSTITDDFISVTITSYTSGTLNVYGGYSNFLGTITGLGTYYFTTGNKTNGTLRFLSSSFIGSIDNISVKLAEDTYRATETIPSGTSLLDSRFQVRDYISNQILAMQKSDGTVHTETLLVDAYAVETTNAILVKNNWAKLENGLYSKGSVVASPIGYWQTLNKGIYSPFVNIFGTKKAGNVSQTAWVEWFTATTMDLSSTAKCFSGSFGGHDNAGRIDTTITYVGRPDSKFYDIIYTDQFRDLRTNAEKANIPQLLNEVESGAVNGSMKGCSDLNDTTSVTSYGTKLVVEDLEGSAQTVWSLTNKAITVHQVLKSTDSGATWTPISFTHQAVANTITIVASDLIKVSYTSSNPIANITTPLAIEQVSNYCKATNSHSIYKGNNITQLLNKVGTGNGDKGLVSKVVEDADTNFIHHKTNGTFNILPQETILVTDEYSGDDIVGAVYRLIDTSPSTQNWITYSNFHLTRYWKLENIFSTTPTHSTIDLDNSDSPAIKYLSTIATNDDGELAYQILAQEVVPNVGVYDGDDSEFTQLTNGSITDLNGSTAKTVVGTLNLGRFK